VLPTELRRTPPARHRGREFAAAESA